MPKYQSQVFTVDLATLQSAGGSDGGDYIMGPPLPTDAVTMGSQVEVIEALAGPELVKATATINLAPQSRPPCDLLADLMTLGLYRCGGQQYRLQVFVKGCLMQELTAGYLKATVFYDQFAL